MRKICIVTSVHIPFDTRIFCKEAVTLMKAGYKVVLIAQHNKDEVVNGIKIIALNSVKNRFFRILFLAKEVYKIALEQKADIYHFHDPELLYWMVKLKKRSGGNIIYDVHENIPGQILTKEWVPFFIRKFIAEIYKCIEKNLLPYIDQIILAEDSYLKMYSGYKNVTVVRNFPLFQGSSRVMEKAKSKTGKTILIYTGGLTKHRGIREMIEAVNYLKDDIKLLLLGSFDNFYFEEEVKKIASRKIEFVGQVPYERVFQYLIEADIGLVILHPIPNYVESLPTKLFEYMMCGLPVIASNFPLWKDIVEKEQCGITADPFNIEEIIKAIDYLIRRPDEAREMGENGKKAVLEKYNWENESKKLLKLYEKLCK